MTDRLEQKILNRTKAPSLHHVKNLNCWGWKISDISIMKQMPNLRVVNLSVNEITTLRHLQDCHQLVELYLRRNLISDLDELQYLQNLKHLRIIWLTDNPCVHLENYRDRVCQILPQLEKLDNQRISKGDNNDDNEVSSKTSLKAKRTLGSQNSKNNSKTEKFSNTGTSMLSSKQSQNSTSDNNVLAAVLCLLKELNSEDLETVILKAQEQMDTYDSAETTRSDNLDVIDEIV